MFQCRRYPLIVILPPGLFVTGSAFRGVGVPDCVHQGKQIVEKLSNEAQPEYA